MHVRVITIPLHSELGCWEQWRHWGMRTTTFR